jgi:hypothetical protein
MHLDLQSAPQKNHRSPSFSFLLRFNPCFFICNFFSWQNYFKLEIIFNFILQFFYLSNLIPILYIVIFFFGMIYKINGFAISSSSFSIRIDPFFFIAIFFLTSFLDWFFFLILSLNIKLVWSWTSWLILCLIFHELWFWNINSGLRDLSGLVWFLIILN